MNLKDFLAERVKPPELFWSLIIEESWVQAGIWHIEKEKSEVISISPSVPWENDNDLESAVDSVLSSATQKLPENYSEPTKTVFGVISSWVLNGEIKDEFLAKIKKVCTELSLAPVGFVVIPEAIAHLYKSVEDSPLSAIIVGLGSQNLEISVFNLGNLVGSTQVSKSISLTDDIIEGLSRFEDVSQPPSRFVIYDGKDGELDEAKEKLLKHVWDEEEKVKFLHTPNIETLSTDKKVLAVSLAGASEIADVSKVSQKFEDELENVEPVSPSESENDLGFVINEDVTQRSELPKTHVEDVLPIKKENILKKAGKIFHSISMPEIKISGFSGKKRVLSLSIFILILLVLMGFAFYYLPKIDATLVMSPKSFEETFELGFNDQNSRIFKLNAEGTKTKSTTGVKVVGEKAKGTVQIANGNASPIKLSSGTLLTSTSGLKFLTLKEASISGQILPGSPGTMDIEVNAGDIGSQFNLAKGEVFTVGNYAKSLVAGTSQNDFSGGSSREITAVNKDDQVNLLKELKEELEGKAKEDLKEKVTSSDIYVDGFSKIDIKLEKFDHKVGDEADVLKLELSMEVTGIVPDKQKLFDHTKTILNDKKPNGFVLRLDQIGYKFTFVNEENNTFNYKVYSKANYLPEIDINSIAKKVSGKSTDDALSYLQTLPGFTRASLTYNSKILRMIGRFPINPKNISIEITAEK